MTHWQDKGTCPQALPGTPRGSPSRPSRWRAHTRHLGAKDDDCSFRLFFEKGRRPSSSLIAASEAVRPGPTCKGTNPENPKAPFSPQAASPAPPRALACKQKGTQSHTHRGSPLLCLLSHPCSFVLPTSFFQFLVVTEVRCFRALPRWCQHQIVTTAQNAALVVTQTRIPSALPRWCQHLSSRFRVVECNRASTTTHHACRHTNPHSIGISMVVGHAIPATRAKSQNAHPEIETSIPQALLTAHVAKTSMAQALPLPPRGPNITP